MQYRCSEQPDTELSGLWESIASVGTTIVSTMTGKAQSTADSAQIAIERERTRQAAEQNKMYIIMGGTALVGLGILVYMGGRKK